MEARLIFATRPSALARWQTEYIIQQLQMQWQHLSCDQFLITTQGDRDLNTSLPEIGGKGLFTYELEQALRDRRVHAAVHSLKDLPTDDSPGLTIGAIPTRADTRDVLVSPAGPTLEELPSGSVIGTSSTRRKAQLLAYRPDLSVEPMRGNVDTRIRKALAGQYDAIILAAAGVIRLGLDRHITQYLPVEVMLPAPGQGALAIQCRSDDEQTLNLLGAIEHSATRQAVTAERAFLSALGGGCSLPVGASAKVADNRIELSVVIAAPDGSQVIRLSASGGDPILLGLELAHEAFERGARSYLPQDSLKNW